MNQASKANGFPSIVQDNQESKATGKKEKKCYNQSHNLMQLLLLIDRFIVYISTDLDYYFAFRFIVFLLS